MNLADHFFQLTEAFTTFSELSAWCARNGVKTPTEKKQLIAALKEIGGREISIKWQGKDQERAFIHIGLLDFTLWNDRDYWGKGATVIDM